MNKLSIGKRLWLGFSLVLLLALVSTGIAMWRLQAAADATRDMMAEPLAKERVISDWYRVVYSGTRRTSAIAKSSDPSLADFFAQDQAEATKSSTAYQQSLEALLRSTDEKTLFTQLSEARDRYKTARDEIVKLKKDGQAEAADKLLTGTFLPASEAYLGKMQALLDHQRAEIDATAAQIAQLNASSHRLLLALLLGLVVLGALCAHHITRSILLPVESALRVAQRVVQGDLTRPPSMLGQSSDEIGQLLQAMEAMRAWLSSTIHGIRQSADSISTASSEIATGNQDLSHRTEQTASNLQQTASSMDQLTGTVKQSADAASQANQLAASATSVAQRGGTVVSEVVQTMDEINQSSRKISDIIGVIDGIAFQTNILALNAAVEAARAGEQGRGFAVVAGEVRSLAQRSAEAAREIKSLIGSSVDKVEAGAKLVAHAGETMNEIVSSVQRVTDIISEITAAAAEQSDGIGQVNGAISQLDQMTQQNAALVEQSAAAAESLRDQARQLGSVVATFQLESAAR